MGKFEAEAQLPEDAYKEISDTVVERFEQKLVGRQILPKDGVDDDAEETSYPKITNDMINAEIIGKKGDIPAEGLQDYKDIPIQIRKIALGYEVSRLDYKRKNFVNRSVRRASYKVAYKEDDVIINGDTTYGIDGITDVAPNTISASNAWSDSSNATPTEDLLDAKAKLHDQSDGRFGEDASDLVLLINEENLTELNYRFSNNDNQRALPFFEKYLGNIITSPMVSEGYAYLMETGIDIAKLVVAEDITTERARYKIEDQKFRGNIFVRSIPVFLQYGGTSGESTAFVELDSL